MYLHQTSGPAPGTVRPVKLEQSMHPAIRANGTLNGFIFFHTGLRHQKPEFQHFQHFSIRLCKQTFDRFLIQLFRFHAMFGKPAFDLHRGVWIGKPGQFIGSGRDHLAVLVVTKNRILHQLLIHQNAPVIDFLIHPVQLHLRFRDGKLPQLLPNLTLRIHIPDTIGFESFPFFRRILRPVPCPSAIRLGRLTGHGEETYKISALLQLFPLDIQYLAHAVQRQGKGKHGRLNGRTLPSRRRKSLFQILGDTGTLKLCIECCFCDFRIFQGSQYPLRKPLSTGKIHNLGWFLIKSVGKK